MTEATDHSFVFTLLLGDLCRNKSDSKPNPDDKKAKVKNRYKSCSCFWYVYSFQSLQKKKRCKCASTLACNLLIDFIKTRPQFRLYEYIRRYLKTVFGYWYNILKTKEFVDCSTLNKIYINCLDDQSDTKYFANKSIWMCMDLFVFPLTARRS